MFLEVFMTLKVEAKYLHFAIRLLRAFYWTPEGRGEKRMLLLLVEETFSGSTSRNAVGNELIQLFCKLDCCHGAVDAEHVQYGHLSHLECVCIIAPPLPVHTQ